MVKAFQRVKGYMLADCWGRRGPKYGNQGRMTVRWANQNIDTWLTRHNPEVALIMFGSNDLSSLEVGEYETTMRKVVKKCLDNGTIVILSTIRRSTAGPRRLPCLPKRCVELPKT